MESPSDNETRRRAITPAPKQNRNRLRKMPKKYAGKQREKKKMARSADVFCCLHFDAVSVLPLAWQAAPACFINTAQAALDENPRFAQVQLHSGELHYLQCTDKANLPGLCAPQETYCEKEAEKRNDGINVRSHCVC